MAISDDDIAKVREASDLVSIFSERVPLRQRGRDFWCCCPFHHEKTPSCKIDPATQLWHCFGCGEGGDVFKFIMKADDVSFPDAVRGLAQRAHIDIAEDVRGGVPNSRKARLREVCVETAAFYHMQLMRSKSVAAGDARSYLSKRGLGGSVPKAWNIGFAPGRNMLISHLRSKGFSMQDMVDANVAVPGRDSHMRDRFYNRIIFPIADAQGSFIAFGGRVVGSGEPKYLNSQETPLFHKSQVLYGLHKAKEAMVSTGTAIIVEGYTDVIMLHENGVCNAVATLGTALTKQHIRVIARYASKRIVYLFDGDEAGQRAADRALGFIDESMTPEAGTARVDLCAVTLPDNLDPADFVVQCGAESLQDLIRSARPLVEYGLDRRIAPFDTSTAEGRARALGEALKVLAPIKDSLLAKDYAVQLSGRLHLREQDVLEELAKMKPLRRMEAEAGSSDAGTRLAYAAETASREPEAIGQVERNRRHMERTLLGLAAQYPVLATRYAQELAQTNWHEEVHANLAQVILDAISSDADCHPACIVATAAEKTPRAAGILTSAVADDEEEALQIAHYVADELAIGDMEQTVGDLKEVLASEADDAESEDRKMLFRSVVELQKEINRRKSLSRPII